MKALVFKRYGGLHQIAFDDIPRPALGLLREKTDSDARLLPRNLLLKIQIGTGGLTRLLCPKLCPIKHL